MKKILLGTLAGAVVGLVIAVQVSGPISAQENERLKTTYEQLDLFGDIFERIRSTYVEEVDDVALIEAAINGMLTSLDPHSSYLPPKDFDEMQVETRGEFGGLGIEVTQEDGFVKVVSPIDDTPAARAGIEAGDFITQIDGESVLGLTLDQAVELMRGEVGEEILLTIFREGTDEPFDVTIVRDIIKLTAVKVRTEGRAIVLRITSFTEKTYSNLVEGIAEEIEANGGVDNIDGFVLDLRNNPGGLLSQAIAVSDAFLDAGEIVSTRGRNVEDSDRFNAKSGDFAEGKPIVVLINGGSASASEIVAGALQDHRRAIIIGTKSFGKGSVQTIMPIAGNGAMRLTTARYYTPSGRSIQSLGITPDILVEQRPRVEKDDSEDTPTRRGRSEADLRGSLNNDSLTDEEIEQLEAERAEQEEIAARRDDDFQLSYGLDILRGLNVLAK
ncbi:MAG: S41 family peptidase [Rhodobacteraceae bacterium]|nr:S41 family peptidase [Paracoccaceae bacterium]